MAEYNIFEIIRSEKKNLNTVSSIQVSKVFAKYYWKYMRELKCKFLDLEYKLEINVINFTEKASYMGNFLFQIFYASYLTSFNIHISIFFLERASLLFFEFISLSIQEKEYKIESNSYLNDAIIFTYKKTMGNVTIDNILEENKNNNVLQNQEKYHELLNIRNCSYLFIKILNKFLLAPEVENFNKIYKNINESCNKIYLKIDIDKFLYSMVSQVSNDYNLATSIFLIRILLDIILEFINLDFFESNKLEKDLKDFTSYLESFFQKFIQNCNLDNLIQETDLKKNNQYQIFKEHMLRYITNH